MASLTFHDKKESFAIQVNKDDADWLTAVLPKISVTQNKILTFNEVKADYEAADREDFELFWYSKPINTLRSSGLLVL